MNIDAMINSMNEKIMNWNDTDVEKFVASFTNEEIEDMIYAMDVLMRFGIDASHFYDENDRVDAYDVVNNYITRWAMDLIDGGSNFATARKLLDKLEQM